MPLLSYYHTLYRNVVEHSYEMVADEVLLQSFHQQYFLVQIVLRASY